MTQTHIISINPESIDNGHPDLPFDIRIFKDSNTHGDISVTSKIRIRHAITIDGKLVGYVHTPQFALEIVRNKFNEIIREHFSKNGTKMFQVKYEKDDVKTVCKIYQVIPGFVYNGRNKLMTIQIDILPRMELKKTVSDEKVASD